jgi:hypothetical protein
MIVQSIIGNFRKASGTRERLGWARRGEAVRCNLPLPENFVRATRAFN